MPSALTIPGVQVQTRFEPAPALPGATGILGVVGVTDRGPVEPTPISQFAEFLDLFGPPSRYTMPEVRSALANGVSKVYVSRIAPGRGTKASAFLFDEDNEPVVKLEARAEGEWGNRITVRVTPVRTLSGQGVKYVNLQILLDGEVVDNLHNLVVDAADPNDLLAAINERSRLIVAVDPLFEKGLPAPSAAVPLAAGGTRAAVATLKAGSADVVVAEAKRAGAAGNRVSVEVADGRASLPLTGAGNAPSMTVRARKPGAPGTNIGVTVTLSGTDPVVTVTPQAPQMPRNYTAPTLAALVTAMENDPDVVVTDVGTVPPSPRAATRLARTVQLTVHPEGRDRKTYSDLPDIAAIAAVSDTLVRFAAAPGNPTALPDAQAVPLLGGRDETPFLELRADPADPPLLELVPAPGVTSTLTVSVTLASRPGDGTPSVTLTILADGEEVETITGLTMDPDDPLYLPAVLSANAFLRAHDLLVRSKTTSLPAGTPRPVKLTVGTSPSTDDYQDALDRLEQAEEVDLVIASVANQLSDAGVRTVHQQVAAHCAKMANVARNRMGLGSATAGESASTASILDHADDVRSDHFVLTTPAGTEGAVAGLLGLQNYFESPTFKAIAAPGAEPGHYTDSQLETLIQGNVLVVQERRGVGIIAMKGILTSGRQINVQRTVNKTVRDIKALSDKYIGLLNNEGDRNALKQQATALLIQMERDGAIVPSTDGKLPSFSVDVYSTQNDFTLGIVRVDLSIRPVRAIDFIYATVFVQN